MFRSQASQVDDSIAHPTQGGIDAHTRAGSDILEIALAIVTQYYHAALLRRQHPDKFAHIDARLVANNVLLNILTYDNNSVA